ncbi:hypothetical protein [Nocardia gipuzkoensis]|uniref:hypothetical protein n=1 Tax=Nocardia gipuzkoensis TaxID=2749991 RepID=UPI00237DD776|nr:hypothetical protein [Nocardia gipuzkoensis]MDE1673817.1 hypothetical protein [Nocardia gipuzkoensis]
MNTLDLPPGYIALEEWAGNTVYANVDHITLITSHSFADGTTGSAVHIVGTESITVNYPPAAVLERITAARSIRSES